jgi:hypothetical protein
MALKKHTGNRVVDMTKEKLAMQKEYKKEFNAHKATQDLLSAMTNERDELEVKVKEWERKQRDGYSWVVLNPDTKLILDGGTVLPYARFIYTQDIDSVIGTLLYSKFPYLELDSNGKICINTDQQKKYKGALK